MNKNNIRARKNTNDIRTIFFDVGGVLLIDFIDDKITDLAQKYHIDTKLLLNARKKYRPLADLGKISDMEFWRKISDHGDIICEEEDWQFDSYLEEIEGMKDLVSALKQNGYDVAILSNDSKEMFTKKRERFNFDKLFNDIIVSSEYGVIKPNPEIYWIALKKINSLPERSVLIDDRSENIKAATDIGMYTVLFQDAEQLKVELYNLGIQLT